MMGQWRFSRHEWFQDVVGIFGLLIITILAEWLGLIRPVRSQLQALTEPIAIVTSQGIAFMGLPFRRLGIRYDAMSRVEELEQELTKNQAKIAELEHIERENQELRQRLGAQNRPARTVIGTPIISYGLPTVSVGEHEGVTSGQPVLAGDTLVGVVDAVHSRQATITLLSDKQSIPLVVKTQSGVEGLIIGDGKRVLLTEVSTDRTLRSGERVVTAGQAGFPANLLVGTIQQVISDQSAPVQTAAIEQLVSFYEVPIVEILP